MEHICQIFMSVKSSIEQKPISTSIFKGENHISDIQISLIIFEKCKKKKTVEFSIPKQLKYDLDIFDFQSMDIFAWTFLMDTKMDMDQEMSWTEYDDSLQMFLYHSTLMSQESITFEITFATFKIQKSYRIGC